jgi:arylsulfatase A-like enzyme
LINHINASGEWDDTVVIFIGDNGTAPRVIGDPFDAQHAKGTLSEGGTAVPFIVAGPGIQPGTEDAIVSVVDIFATALEVAGVDVAAATASDPVDSVSLWPLLVGGADTVRDHMLSELFGGPSPDARKAGHAIRNADHKLVCYEDGDTELFDLADDRWGVTNLYANGPAAGYETVYDDLATTLESWTSLDLCPE